MGSKSPMDYSYLSPCEDRKECPFNYEGCKHEKCGFYYRVHVKVSIEETIKDLRLMQVKEKQISSLKDILDSSEFRKQALYRFYRP